MRDEGFLSPAGKRFVAIAAVLIIGAVVAYALLEADLDIDLDELTTQSSTTEVEVDSPETDFTAPNPLDDPYFRCLENAQTADEIFACSEK
jgi:hypothetical protein